MIELFGFTVDIGWVILVPTLLIGVVVIWSQWHHLDEIDLKNDKGEKL